MYKIDNWTIYSHEEYNHIGKSDYVSNRGKHKKSYCSEPMFLDTETSKLTHFIYNKQTKRMEEKPYVSWVYQWALCVDGNRVVVGRKPSELMKVLKDIADKNVTAYESNESFYITRGNGKKQRKSRTLYPETYRTMVYVHNLSYDYSYLYPFLEKTFGEREFLATQPHKIFSLVYPKGHIEFRCSFKLTNKSLAKWSEGLGVPHAKLSGAIDYNIVRFQDSELTQTDWNYQIYDVLSMYESFHETIKRDGDTLVTIPYTSTGYVRRLIKQNFQSRANKKYMDERDYIQANHKLTMETYSILRDCYCGAISTGNYKYYGITVRGDIRHRDYTSHYPTQQICKLFPMGKLELIYDKNEFVYDIDLDNDILADKENASFVRIVFKDLEIHDEVTIPYISASKIIPLHDENGNNPRVLKENGRVLKVEGLVLYNGTDLDLKWIKKQYSFDYEVQELYKSKLDKLPTYLTDIVNKSFYGKSYYKLQVRKAEKEYGEGSEELYNANYDLMKSKNTLNGIYGCTATDPVRDEIIQDLNVWKTDSIDRHDTTNMNFQKAIEDYNKSMYLNYSAGVYCTALARDELMTCVELIGYENILYCDTDSAFYLSNSEIENKIENLNKTWRAEAEEKGFYVTVEGKKVYYHNFDEESPIRAFKSLHAKCYAMEVLNEKTNEYQLSCTIAGVKSKVTRWENGIPVTYYRDKELGNIENLKEGFVFSKTGTTSICYIDVPWVENVNIDEHIIETCNGGVVMNQCQTLSNFATEYKYLKVSVSD